MSSRIWYNAGAVAVMYAIHKANANRPGGRTSLDFWQSTDCPDRGFWHCIEPYNQGMDGSFYPSSVPEGQGWKKALAIFTGFATAADFYVSFETWAAASSVSELLAVVEANEAVYTMSGVQFVAPSNMNAWPHMPKVLAQNGAVCEASSDGANSGGLPPGFTECQAEIPELMTLKCMFDGNCGASACLIIAKVDQYTTQCATFASSAAPQIAQLKRSQCRTAGETSTTAATSQPTASHSRRGSMGLCFAVLTVAWL
jgi:hypothetical protein